MTIAKLGIGRSARIVGDLGEGGGLLDTSDAKGRHMESCNLNGSPTYNTVHGTWCPIALC